MDRSSPLSLSVDNSTAFPDYRTSAGNQSEAQALNKSLRKEKSEKKLPDSQAWGDRDPSKSLSSFRASQYSNPGVSITQGKLTGSELHSSDQPQAEDSSEKVKNKKIFFEGKIAEQKNQTHQPKTYRSPHSPSHSLYHSLEPKNQPEKVSPDGQWLKKTDNDNDPPPATREQDIQTTGQNPPVSATRHQPTAPPARTGLSLLSPPHHQEAATSTEEQPKAQPAERANQEQELQDLIDDINNYLARLRASQVRASQESGSVND